MDLELEEEGRGVDNSNKTLASNRLNNLPLQQQEVVVRDCYFV